MEKTLRIVHDGSVTVMKSGGIILGKQSLEDILYKEMKLDETSFSESFDAVVTIMIQRKPGEAVVRWIPDETDE